MQYNFVQVSQLDATLVTTSELENYRESCKERRWFINQTNVSFGFHPVKFLPDKASKWDGDSSRSTDGEWYVGSSVLNDTTLINCALINLLLI